MPFRSRTSMRQQAKIIRAIGETVWLRTSTAPTDTRQTPMSIVAADAPDPTEYTETAIYAYVQWGNDNVVYDETGHVHNVEAIVTATAQWMNAMRKCFAVRFSDGTVLRKTDELLSDERTSFAIKCVGEANVVNN